MEGYVSELNEALDRLTRMIGVGAGALGEQVEKLTQEIDRQGLDLSLKLTSATDVMNLSLEGATKRMAETVEKASAASDKFTGRLVLATWVLAGSTGVLAILTAILVYVTWVKGG